MSRNECPFSPSPLVSEYLSKYIDSINRYELPGFYEELISRVAEYSSIDEKYVELLLGSEEFFTLIPWFMLRNRCKFMYFSPTFTPAVEDLYPWGFDFLEIDLDENYMIDLDKALEKCDERTIVYVIRPNNPTGNIPIDCSCLAEIARRARLVVIDEAYYEFSKQTCIDLISIYSNIVILRTLSKAFCIAGARLGYMISSPETLAEITRTRRSYSIPLSTILIGLGALSDLEYMEKVVNEIISIKKYTVEELRKQPGVEVVDTLTNFILVGKKGFDSKTLYEKLLEKDIFVKPLEKRLSRYIRVSIGKLLEMNIFINTFRNI